MEICNTNQSTVLVIDPLPGHVIDQTPGHVVYQSPGLVVDQSPGLEIDQPPVLVDHSHEFVVYQSSGHDIDQSSGHVIDQSPGLTIDQPPELAINQSPGLAIDQSPVLVNDQLLELAIDQSPVHVNDQSPRHVTDQSPGLFIDLSNRRVVDQLPALAIDQSPGLAIDRSPVLINDQSPGRVTDQSHGLLMDLSNKRAVDQLPGLASDQSLGLVIDSVFSLAKSNDKEHSTKHELKLNEDEIIKKSSVPVIKHCSVVLNNVIEDIIRCELMQQRKQSVVKEDIDSDLDHSYSIDIKSTKPYPDNSEHTDESSQEEDRMSRKRKSNSQLKQFHLYNGEDILPFERSLRKRRRKDDLLKCQIDHDFFMSVARQQILRSENEGKSSNDIDMLNIFPHALQVTINSTPMLVDWKEKIGLPEYRHSRSFRKKSIPHLTKKQARERERLWIQNMVLPGSVRPAYSVSHHNYAHNTSNQISARIPVSHHNSTITPTGQMLTRIHNSAPSSNDQIETRLPVSYHNSAPCANDQIVTSLPVSYHNSASRSNEQILTNVPGKIDEQILSDLHRSYLNRCFVKNFIWSQTSSSSPDAISRQNSLSDSGSAISDQVTTIGNVSVQNNLPVGEETGYKMQDVAAEVCKTHDSQMPANKTTPSLHTNDEYKEQKGVSSDLENHNNMPTFIQNKTVDSQTTLANASLIVPKIEAIEPEHSSMMQNEALMVDIRSNDESESLERTRNHIKQSLRNKILGGAGLKISDRIEAADGNYVEEKSTDCVDKFKSTSLNDCSDKLKSTSSTDCADTLKYTSSDKIKSSSSTYCANNFKSSSSTDCADKFKSSSSTDYVDTLKASSSNNTGRLRTTSIPALQYLVKKNKEHFIVKPSGEIQLRHKTEKVSSKVATTETSNTVKQSDAISVKLTKQPGVIIMSNSDRNSQSIASTDENCITQRMPGGKSLNYNGVEQSRASLRTSENHNNTIQQLYTPLSNEKSTVKDFATIVKEPCTSNSSYNYNTRSELRSPHSNSNCLSPKSLPTENVAFSVSSTEPVNTRSSTTSASANSFPQSLIYSAAKKLGKTENADKCIVFVDDRLVFIPTRAGKIMPKAFVIDLTTPPVADNINMFNPGNPMLSVSSEFPVQHEQHIASPVLLPLTQSKIQVPLSSVYGHTTVARVPSEDCITWSNTQLPISTVDKFDAENEINCSLSAAKNSTSTVSFEAQKEVPTTISTENECQTRSTSELTNKDNLEGLQAVIKDNFNQTKILNDLVDQNNLLKLLHAGLQSQHGEQSIDSTRKNDKPGKIAKEQNIVLSSCTTRDNTLTTRSEAQYHATRDFVSNLKDCSENTKSPCSLTMNQNLRDFNRANSQIIQTHGHKTDALIRNTHGAVPDVPSTFYGTNVIHNKMFTSATSGSVEQSHYIQPESVLGRQAIINSNKTVPVETADNALSASVTCANQNYPIQLDSGNLKVSPASLKEGTNILKTILTAPTLKTRPCISLLSNTIIPGQLKQHTFSYESQLPDSERMMEPTNVNRKDVYNGEFDEDIKSAQSLAQYLNARVHTLKTGHELHVKSPCISSDGNINANANCHNTIQVFSNSTTGDHEKILEIKSEPDYVHEFAPIDPSESSMCLTGSETESADEDLERCKEHTISVPKMECDVKLSEVEAEEKIKSLTEIVIRQQFEIELLREVCGQKLPKKNTL